MNRKSDRAGYKATARVAQAIFSRFTRYKWLVAYQVGLCGFALAGGLSESLLACLGKHLDPFFTTLSKQNNVIVG